MQLSFLLRWTHTARRRNQYIHLKREVKARSISRRIDSNDPSKNLRLLVYLCKKSQLPIALQEGNLSRISTLPKGNPRGVP